MRFLRYCFILILFAGVTYGTDYQGATTLTGNLSYVDGGDTTQTFDMETEPCFGYILAQNSNTNVYDAVRGPAPTSVVVGEVTVTDPQSWFYDYKYSTESINTLPGIYDNALEALQAASDEAGSHERNAQIYIAAGTHICNGNWTITWPGTLDQFEISGAGLASKLQFATGGVVLNCSSYGQGYIHDLYINGSGYTDGYAGISICSDASMMPSPLIIARNRIGYFNIGIDVSDNVIGGPYNGEFLYNYMWYCNIGLDCGGCRNLIMGNVAAMDVGSDSIGIKLSDGGGSTGYNTLVSNDGEKCDTGVMINTPRSITIGQYMDAGMPVDAVGINISNGADHHTIIMPPRVTNRWSVDIGRDGGGSIVDTEIYGLYTYTSYANSVRLGSDAKGVFFQTNGKWGHVNITNDGATDIYHTRMLSASSATADDPQEGDVIINTAVAASGTALWGYDADTTSWKSISYDT